MDNMTDHPTLLQRPIAWLLFAAGLLSFLLLGATLYASYRINNPAAGFQIAQQDNARLSIDNLRQAAGYNGFAGAIARFAASIEEKALEEMRGSHQGIYAALAALRNSSLSATPLIELRSVLNGYDNAMRIAEDSAAQPANQMLALAAQNVATLQPLIDRRIDILSNELSAKETKQWSQMLFWLALAGAVLGVILATTLYRLLTDNMLNPLQNLRRSIITMSRDQNTAIWGIERQDAVGDVARAVDLARYHFTQVPDISVISDQGPVRLKFDGQSASLFEAMTQVMMDSSRHMVNDANKLAGAVHANREGLDLFTNEMQQMIRKLVGLSADYAEKTAQLHSTLTTAVTIARDSQHEAIERITAVLPQLEQYSGVMEEVVVGAGNQMRDLVQSLMVAERMLHVTAAQSQQTSNNFSQQASDLTERLFAATSLLRNSGEVLAQNAQASRTSVQETVSELKQAEFALYNFLDQSASRLNGAVSAVEQLASAAKQADANAVMLGTTTREIFQNSELFNEQVTLLQSANPATLTASLADIMGILMELAQQMKQLGSASMPVTKAALSGATPSQLEQTLSSMGDIFASLRDRGDDVINRLNRVAHTLEKDGSGQKAG